MQVLPPSLFGDDPTDAFARLNMATPIDKECCSFSTQSSTSAFSEDSDSEVDGSTMSQARQVDNRKALETQFGVNHFVATAKRICVSCPAFMFSIVITDMLREIIVAYADVLLNQSSVETILEQAREQDGTVAKGVLLGVRVLKGCMEEGVDAFFLRMEDASAAGAFLKA